MEDTKQYCTYSNEDTRKENILVNGEIKVQNQPVGGVLPKGAICAWKFQMEKDLTYEINIKR